MPINNRNRSDYRRGDSPFYSPKVGDVLKSKRGMTRLVTAIEGDCVFFDSRNPRTMLVRFHETTRKGWAQWCSRCGAVLTSRNGVAVDETGKLVPSVPEDSADDAGPV